METLTITRPQLEAALRRWEQDARDGKTRSHAESDALPLDQVAAESAGYLWSELGATASGVGARTLAGTDFPGGLTVADLKAAIRDWPEADGYGDPCEVWLCSGNGTSNQAKMVSPLNLRSSDDGSKRWADFLLGHDA